LVRECFIRTFGLVIPHPSEHLWLCWLFFYVAVYIDDDNADEGYNNNNNNYDEEYKFHKFKPEFLHDNT
jgi:hypothetical protein